MKAPGPLLASGRDADIFEYAPEQIRFAYPHDQADGRSRPRVAHAG